MAIAPAGDGVSWWVWVAAFVLLVAWSVVKRDWRFFVQWLQGVRGKDWPTIPATIDNVSVAEQIDNSGKGPPIITYLATLTYFYRNPELQVGDYSREFGPKDEAQDWANSYKGKTVMVHIDPRDPTKSVLTKEEVLRNEAPY